MSDQSAEGGRADTWTRAWHAVGHRVAALVDAPAPVTADTVPLAVASHATTIRLLVEIHRDLTNRAGNSRLPTPTVELLETNPVKALGAALERHPSTPGVALSDVMTTKPPPGSARDWHDLARASTVAARAWRDAEPASRPQRDQAWSLMADVAAVSQGLAVLDLDISHAATRLTEQGQELLGVSAGVLSERYGNAATQGLRAGGERTRTVAAHGPLPDVAPLREPISGPGAVRLPAHVPGAQAATVELLDHAEPISPIDLAVVVRAQARLSEHAERLTKDPRLADLARQHALQLATVVPRGLSTIEPASDLRPLQQTQALLTYLRTVRAEHPDAGKIAAAIARSQPDMVDALYRSSRQQLGAGTWLVPNPNERSTTAIWVRQPARAERQPDLVDRLVDARASAQDLAAASGTNPFPDAEAAIAVATARQGLPPRAAIRCPSLPRATDRPAMPGRTLSHQPSVER